MVIKERLKNFENENISKGQFSAGLDYPFTRTAIYEMEKVQILYINAGMIYANT